MHTLSHFKHTHTDRRRHRYIFHFYGCLLGRQHVYQLSKGKGTGKGEKELELEVKGSRGPVDTSPHTGQEPIWQRRERLFGMKSKSKHLQNYAHKSFNTFVAKLDAALGVALALQGLLKLAHFRPGCTAGCLCLVYTLHSTLSD